MRPFSHLEHSIPHWQDVTALEQVAHGYLITGEPGLGAMSLQSCNRLQNKNLKACITRGKNLSETVNAQQKFIMRDCIQRILWL